MNFCPQCAAPLAEETPAGDDRLRKVCTRCSTVHYQNPLVVVGCLVERESEIMLCRRAIEPRRGLWTVPAGFLELGEGVRAGALRETMEEAGASVEIVAPHTQLDLPHIGQTYSLFRARMSSPEFSAGEESLEVEFVPFEEIPWGELAFPVVHFALELLVRDRTSERSRMHLGTLRWSGEAPRWESANYELEDHQFIAFDQ